MDSQEPKAGQESIVYTQEETNDGQRKINGQLCRVDRRLIEILKLLRNEIAKFPVFQKADFSEFDRLLKEVYQIHGEVANIKPPGCEPQYLADPKWTVVSPS